MKFYAVFLLFFLSMLIATKAPSQTDTIFKTNLETINCRITAVNQHKIFYLDQKETGRYVDLVKVLWYSRDGKRKVPELSGINRTGSKIDSVNISDEVAYMRSCMSKFHTQYTTGLSISLIGGALAGTSAFIIGDETTQQITGIGGLVMMLVGVGVTIDAHRWFGKAGWGVSGKGNMVQVRYRFK